MRKTSIFYSIKFTLLILLAWMLLLDEAVRLNMSRETAQDTAVVEEEKQEGSAVEAEGEGQVKLAAAAEEKTEPTTADMKPSAVTSASENIRVLLMTTGYQSYFHPEVTVQYDGKTITYTPSSPELLDAPVILSAQKGGIPVLSIERQQGNPSYEGSLEIKNTAQGLLLINELPLESYLEAVVPSEMPSSYEAEALKAQAVCARTYACRQMQEHRLEEYGADVDDSVSFQVYENIAPQESTTAAVNATKGQILCQNGEPIQAYYFSTSAGVTSTDEIWGAEQASAYLKAVECEFDQEMPWSSWTVEIPWDALAQRCGEYLSGMDAAGGDGSSGNLKSLEITRKNQSGAVTGLHVVTEAGSFDLTEEYSIREFLSPNGCEITEKDGTLTQGGTLLPSAYFTMEVSRGESIAITGRGFGHGVGMSQTAANEMAARGYYCSEILDYFFKDVEMRSMNDPE